MEDIEKLVNEALEQSKPSNQESFGYHGELALGETWAWTFSQHRDSDCLDRSNYAAILADLTERFPNDVCDERYGHWAVGWVERICVRMRNDDGSITEAAGASFKWKDKLKNYPIADEEAFTAMEFEESLKSLQTCWNLTEEEASQVHRWLGDHGCDTNPDGLSTRDVERAKLALGLTDVEH